MMYDECVTEETVTNSDDANHYVWIPAEVRLDRTIPVIPVA